MPNIDITISDTGRLVKIFGTASTGFSDGYIIDDNLDGIDGFFVIPTEQRFDSLDYFNGFSLPHFSKSGNKLSWTYDEELSTHVCIDFMYGGF